MNQCEAGHGEHETVTVDLSGYFNRSLSMRVFHPERYRDTRGYCPGDDAVSRSLVESGFWEWWDSKELVRRGVFTGGLVIDVGAHIGWYSLLAAVNDCRVSAIEGDPENVRLFQDNIERNGFTDKVDVALDWVEPGWSLEVTEPVDLVKVDIEGKDALAVEGLWGCIESGLVEHLMVEISPVFSSGYRELVERLTSAGYRAEVLGPTVFDLPSLAWVDECHQVDMLFTKGVK